MRITTNTRNLALEGPTHRCVSLSQSLNRPPPVPSAPALLIDPNEPTFGVVQVGGTYQLKLRLLNTSKDVVRLRLVPPPNAHKSVCTMGVKVGTTKTSPGIPVAITITADCVGVGPFDHEFTLVAESESYNVTVKGHVLDGENFDALSMLRRLEGKSVLEKGVTRVGGGAGAGGEEDAGGEGPEGGGDGGRGAPSLEEMFDSNLLEEAKYVHAKREETCEAGQKSHRRRALGGRPTDPPPAAGVVAHALGFTFAPS